MEQKLTTRTGVLLYAGEHPTLRAALETAIQEGIILDGIDLTGASLKGANLDNAHIMHANFTNADLTGANMSESVLKHCNFSGARMIDTCLCYSDLLGCNFLDTTFGATDISMARLDGSAFLPQACLTLSLESAHSLSCIVLQTPQGKKVISHPPIVIKNLNELVICAKMLNYENNISYHKSIITI
ncbi:MAG TPA: pentapeptide repeat-containing protein [Alphaproteobacteria bacterium]|nr:pentapeptide repeat-containing protein [Alphaproteobacteria bacterium]